MRVLRGYSRSVPAPTVLTIGNFDGVHRGHLALLDRLQVIAAEQGLMPAVLTFEPHPREFFTPELAPPRLCILREKIELLEAAGIEAAMICPFDAELANLPAEDFIQRILVEALRVKHLIIGDDFRFGAKRRGDFALLCAAGKTYGFTVEAMGTQRLGETRISSSAVREALEAGDMERATKLLGRPYIIDGRVVHGEKLGRRLGFATANIYVRHHPMPMTGVFAVEVTGVRGMLLTGVANLGTRPTVDGTKSLLEVHLFDFGRFIYGAHLSVRFKHKLRDEMKFSDIDALKAQITLDAEAAREYFRQHPPSDR